MGDRRRLFEPEWPDFVWAARAVGARCDHEDNCEYEDDNYRRYDHSGHGDQRLLVVSLVSVSQM
jgi:hypothetical protein